MELEHSQQGGTLPTIVGEARNSLSLGSNGIAGRLNVNPLSVDAVVNPLIGEGGAAVSFRGPNIGSVQTRVGVGVIGGQVDYSLALNGNQIGGERDWRISAGPLLGMFASIGENTRVGVQIGGMQSLTDGLAKRRAEDATGGDVDVIGAGFEINWRAVLEQSLGRNLFLETSVGSDGVAAKFGLKL